MRKYLAFAALSALACVVLVETAQAAGKKNFPGGRGRCYHAQTAMLDPIARTSHLHEFFGSRAIRSNDVTYSDLREGETTCNREDDKSAYWMPAIKWDGEVLTPYMSGFYFQTVGQLDPLKTKPFPKGFRMIAGEGPEQYGKVEWICDSGTNKPRFPDPPRCEEPEKGLGLKITFPECWDGKKKQNGVHSVVSAVKKKGKKVCPGHHPVQLPTLTMWPNYKAIPSEEGEVEVSMGHEEWGPPETMHADVIIGFDTKEMVERCIVGPARRGTDVRPWFCNADRFDD